MTEILQKTVIIQPTKPQKEVKQTRHNVIHKTLLGCRVIMIFLKALWMVVISLLSRFIAHYNSQLSNLCKYVKVPKKSEN